jgi:hypothetical protein
MIVIEDLQHVKKIFFCIPEQLRYQVYCEGRERPGYL